ncbi:MAG: shikimate dehydrogenase [Candidatus Arsenophonus melophagi]|nr:shikimate dehydrogenase [Candidatus Arsenophonus melophagi]
MEEFAVFGNPVAHSKSPIIHNFFSEQTGIKYNYGKVFVPINKFEEKLDDFFYRGGKGGNITLPFKRKAYHKVHELTERAKICGSVNTIKRLNGNRLLGDNTDGIGLILDLERLQFIKNGSHVLVIGAGGAARGIITALLRYGCRITITNRTFSKADKLSESFAAIGNINSLMLESIHSVEYDLIINATSSGITGEFPFISKNIFKQNVFCYDLLYSVNSTPFLTLAKAQGVLHYTDGIGMLVGQAAFAFKLWHGILPNISYVIKRLKKILI